MKTIAMVIPYFTRGKGPLPKMAALWLHSCRMNPTVDWLLFTDCGMDGLDVPENVRVVQTGFEAVRERIQALFDFPICLETPYKLCDFKPVYGEAFAKELEPYDFWGFCDMDVIWGDIRRFITDDLLERHDRVLTHGHCSLLRNRRDINAGYRTLEPKGCLRYRDVFTTARIMAFDEWAGHSGGGYVEIQKRNGLRVFDAYLHADVEINRWSLNTFRGYERMIFHIRDGGLEELALKEGRVVRNEVLYAHFQQRKLDFDDGLDMSDYFVVPPNRAINDSAADADGLSAEKLRRMTSGSVLSWNVSGQLRGLASRLKHAVLR